MQKTPINEFTIVYTINTGLNVNKTFREKVEKRMYTEFGTATKPFIKTTFSKKENKSIRINNFFETGSEKIAYRVLSCIIYTITKNHVCIDYIACQSKN